MTPEIQKWGTSGRPAAVVEPQVYEIEPTAGIPLGTAAWLTAELAVERFGYQGASPNCGRIFIGEALDAEGTPLGYIDDRHVCVVSGSRGGKGVGTIVPNLAFWPGSSIIVDPKGENAAVTAQRRGPGSPYSWGMGQKVCLLDPFDEVDLPASMKAHYNPLDAIDPNSDYAIDDAARIASSLVVVQSRTDPYWEEAARNLIKGLILHVISASYLAKDRSLVMVRRLLTQGDEAAAASTVTISSGQPLDPFEVLWAKMRSNKAFNGVVSGVGAQLATMADKQHTGVLESARTNTEFLDGPAIQRVLSRSDFNLGELKTNPNGLTIYLTLPARYMPTHFRWLRLMITLALGEMERIKGRPATGHPTLFLLDEFAGLKRMEVVEHAAAQAAGFGVKFFFVVQNLAQLNEIYEKSWETFLGNSGLKLLFQIDDDFTRQYVSRQLGTLETVRVTQSGGESRSNSFSTNDGTSTSWNSGDATTRSPWLGIPQARNRSRGDSSGYSHGTSTSDSVSTSTGWNQSVQQRALLNPDEIGRLLARIDDPSRPGYPGLVLALTPGERPLLARRVNYFQSPRFRGSFDPHPDHPRPPTLAELQAQYLQPPPGQVLAFSKPKIDFGLVREAILALVLVAAFLGGVSWGGYALYQWGAPKVADWWRSIDTRAVASTAPANSSSSYKVGYADYKALQRWEDALNADARTGVEWWAEHRKSPPTSCFGAGRTYAGTSSAATEFIGGCNAAKTKLDAMDRLRNTDSDYRDGFNAAAR